MILKMLEKKNNFLWFVLTLAFLLRLWAAFFAKGFSMYDDHFVIIEYASKIANNISFFTESGRVIKQSLVYPSCIALIFKCSQAIGITAPQTQMLVVRIVHAIYSLLMVIFSWLIAQKLSNNKKTADRIALIMAVFYIFPFMSVRNLVEFVCIPPLMIGYYFSIKSYSKNSSKYLLYSLLAGLALGLSSIIRYQAALIPGVIFIFMIFKKRVKPAFLLLLGCILATVFIQGSVDYFFYKAPFLPFWKYVLYNLEHSKDYITSPFYTYFILLAGIFIPPNSLGFIWSFIRYGYRKAPIMFVSSSAFFLYHSAFPNKQERFVLPIVPVLIIVGYLGLEEFQKTEFYKKRLEKITKGFKVWFWAINLLLLVVLNSSYSKKSRVEAMTFLSNIDDVRAVLIESHEKKVPRPPMFYLNKDVEVYLKSRRQEYSEILDSISIEPNYIVFLGNKNIEDRIESFSINTGWKMKQIEVIKPSLIDDILYRLNPKHNINKTSYIYKITD